MMKVSPAQPLPSFLPPGQLGRKGVEYQQASGQTRDFRVSVQTREGDVVTISGADLQKLAVSAAPGEVSAEAVVAEFRSSSIQGDLNEEELADIHKLLNDLQSIAGHFFAGRFDQATARAGRLGDLGTSLVRLDASFSRSLSFSSLLTSHPLPSSFREAVSGLAKAEMQPPGGESPPDFKGLLNERRQQIRNLLADLDPPALGTDRPSFQSPARTARDLFHWAMAELPRQPAITPLLPEIGNQAIRQAASFFPPDAQAAATRLQDEFQDLFSSWLLTT